MRYALLVEYDGTELHGSQLQKGVRTVQGDLEGALAQIYGSAVRVSMAGRTDSGVHAHGQVAALDAAERHNACTVRDAINYHLADDVVVKRVETVEENFDPRRQALKREYVFTLNDGPTRSTVNRLYEVRTKRLDNFDGMKSAASLFAGSHDFASFAGPAVPADASTVRHMYAVEVRRTDETRCEVTITGNAFIHQQVRRMTGALVRVGTGKMGPDELEKLLSNPTRGAAGWPLGPEGLCLRRIEYGKDGPFQVKTEYN